MTAGTDPRFNGLRGLPYTVVRITAGVMGQPDRESFGTGFFYSLPTSPHKTPVIVSNKHVLVNRPWLAFEMAPRTADGGRLHGPAIRFRVDAGVMPVMGHPDPNVDLAIVPAQPIMNHLEAAGQPVLPVFISPATTLRPEDEDELHAATPVLMIGFPNGLRDKTNNLPVVRRGALATPYSADYEGRPDFMVDIAAFGGSSGSPVFAYFDSLRMRGGAVTLGGPVETPLIGILHSGPTIDAKGAIVSEPVPTGLVSVTKQMINLGLCAKAKLLDDFIEPINRMANEIGTDS